MTIPRPLNHLISFIKLYPSTSQMVNNFRRRRGKDLHDWPDWCFMPMAGWYAVVCEDNQLRSDQILPLHLGLDVGRLASLATWRYSQGIYQFDADFLAALSDTQILGDMPSEVLYRLPEWCIYIETTGRKWTDAELYGFWAHLEYDINTGRSELRFLIDTENGLLSTTVHLGPWTVTEAVDRAHAEASRHANAAGLPFNLGINYVQKLAANINPLISLLLYICSDAPDIDDERDPGTSPKRPAPRKTKSGWQLFPADKPRFWKVGRQIGGQLRSVADICNDTGRTVKVHVRRGHWHGYWTGPRDSERQFIYKWLMPMVVAGE